jgi:hypothetical protein
MRKRSIITPNEYTESKNRMNTTILASHPMFPHIERTSHPVEASCSHAA